MKRNIYYTIFLIGFMSFFNIMFIYDNIAENIKISKYILGIVASFSAIIVFFLEVFCIALFCYFLNAGFGRLMVFKDVFNVISNSLIVLPYYIFVNNVLLLTSNENILNSRGYDLKILYMPMYIIIIYLIFKNMKKYINNKFIAMCDGIVGAGLIFVLTGLG